MRLSALPRRGFLWTAITLLVCVGPLLLLSTRADCDDARADGAPAVELEFDSLGSYAWAGESRLIVLGRRLYRRPELSYVSLTPDFKLGNLSPSNDLRRFAFGSNGVLSASPDGHWLLGSDVRGPRAIDLNAGESQSWPGDPGSGYWIPGATGWLEVVRLKGVGDEAAQEKVERDLNARKMEARLFEPFGDEWTNTPVQRAQFSLPFESQVLGATSRSDLLVVSRSLPSSQEVRLSTVRVGRSSRPPAGIVLNSPRGGEIASIALSPDGRSVAYLTIVTEEEPAAGAPLETLSSQLRRKRWKAELWVTPFDRFAPRRVCSRMEKDERREYGESRFRTESSVQPRSLQWRPDGRSLSYAVNDSLVIVRLPSDASRP